MPNPISASEQTGPATRPVVLVVEDEILIRFLISEHLRDVGFTVIEASNADDAAAVIQSESPVDLVFSDINMPGGMDGQCCWSSGLTCRSF